LVVPPSELDRFSRVAKLLAPSSSLLDQMVVADFMIEGHFARHLKRMRRLYAERRDALATALRATFGDKLTLEVPPGGMHVIGRLSHCRNIAVLTERAQRAGLNLLASCIIGRSADFALLLSFTNIPVQSQGERRSGYMICCSPDCHGHGTASSACLGLGIFAAGSLRSSRERYDAPSIGCVMPTTS